MIRISKDPLKDPVTGIQIIGWVLYLFLICISIWATGESLSRSFQIPLLVGYLIGGVISSSCAAFLYIIKNAIGEKSSSKLMLTVFALIIVWTLSLLTNTHQFYLVGVLDKLRKEELKNNRNHIDNLPVATYAFVDLAKENFVDKVTGHASAVKNEILDEGKPGLGPRAKQYIFDAEDYMGIPITQLGAKNTSKSGISDLAKRQFKLLCDLRDEMGKKKFDAAKVELSNYFKGNQKEMDKVLALVESVDKDYESKTDEQVKKSLLDSRSFYSKAYDYVSDRLKSIQKYGGAKFIKKLPERVESVELENIANSFNYVRRNGEYNQPRFLLAFAIAFAIDIAGFIIFYFMALPSKKRWD